MENKKKNEEAMENVNSTTGTVEELDLDILDEVTGGSLKNVYRTPTQDISGDTKAKI